MHISAINLPVSDNRLTATILSISGYCKDKYTFVKASDITLLNILEKWTTELIICFPGQGSQYYTDIGTEFFFF